MDYAKKFIVDNKPEVTFPDGLRDDTKYTKTRKFFRFAKDEHIVRLHIGLEDPQDLIEDLKRSLKFIK